MIENPFVENARVLRRAYEEEVIDSSLSIFRDAPVNMMRWMNSVKSLEPKVPFVSLQQNPEALRTQIHTFGRTPADLDMKGTDHIQELARITVPPDNIGYLTNIEQYIADRDGGMYPSRAQYWGMPYHETVDYDEIVWIFRLESYLSIAPTRFTYTGVAPLANYESVLPGRPFSDLPQFNGLWYPATKRNAFCAIIPEGHILRLYAYLPGSDLPIYNWRVACKLTAYLQSSLCDEAHTNSRILF